MSDASTEDEKVPGNREFVRQVRDTRDELRAEDDPELAALRAYHSTLDGYATMLWRRARANFRWLIFAVSMNLGAAVLNVIISAFGRHG